MMARREYGQRGRAGRGFQASFRRRSTTRANPTNPLNTYNAVSDDGSGNGTLTLGLVAEKFSNVRIGLVAELAVLPSEQ